MSHHEIGIEKIASFEDNVGGIAADMMVPCGLPVISEGRIHDELNVQNKLSL